MALAVVCEHFVACRPPGQLCAPRWSWPCGVRAVGCSGSQLLLCLVGMALVGMVVASAVLVGLHSEERVSVKSWDDVTFWWTG